MKPDYSDLYKFVVSLAIVLLSLAVLAPLFVLRESFNIQISATELAQLSPAARQLVEYRQEAALLLTRSVVWISGGTALLGFALLFIGFNEWRKRQEKADLQHDYEVEKLRREVVGSMTAAEIAQKALQELGLDSAQLDQPDTQGSTHPSYVLAKYLRIKELFADRLLGLLGSDSGYLVRRDEIIGDSKYSFIMQGRDSQTPDAIIEVRYSVSSASQAWMQGEIGRVALALQDYRRLNRKRDVYAIVIFALPKNILPGDRQDQYSDKFGVDLLDPMVLVRFVAVEELEGFDAAKVTALLPKLVRGKIAQNKDRILRQTTSRRRIRTSFAVPLSQAAKIMVVIFIFGLWIGGLYTVARLMGPQWMSSQRNVIIVVAIGIVVFILVATTLLRKLAPFLGVLTFSDARTGFPVQTVLLRGWSSTVRLGRRRLREEGATLRRLVIESGISLIVVRARRHSSQNREATITVYDETGSAMYEGTIEQNERLYVSPDLIIGYE